MFRQWFKESLDIFLVLSTFAVVFTILLLSTLAPAWVTLLIWLVVISALGGLLSVWSSL